MKDTNETTAYRVTITLDNAKLPVEEQDRNALFTEFGSGESLYCVGFDRQN